MLFGIQQTDYTKYIVNPTYQVNQQDEYESWKDADGLKHRVVYRSRISGTFDMKFLDRAQYQSFLTALGTVKQDGYYTVSLYVNNTLQLEQVDAFIQIEPAMQAQYSNVPEMNKFKVKVEER